MLLNVFFTHRLLTEPHPGQNDFLARWEGARSFWVEGVSPYSDEASLNIQERIFGRAATGNEDPNLFVYPFFAVFFLWPLVWLPYAWASAIWLVFLEGSLLVALFLLLDLYQWRPKPWLLALLVFWTLAFYYATRALFMGQMAIVVYLLEVLAMWALAKGRDRLAGVSLALSILKPQMGFLLVPFLLLWALRERRWRLITAFGACLGLLALASFATEPSWLSGWIEQMRLYPQYTARAYPAFGSPVWIALHHYLGLSELVVSGVNLLFLGLMLWAGWTVLMQGHRERFLWALMIVLTVTHLVALRTATAHFIVFIIPAIFYFKLIAEHRRAGGQWTALALVATLVLPWVHFILTVQESLEHPTLFLPPAFGMMLLLWVTREQWWRADAWTSSNPITVERRGPRLQRDAPL